MKRLADRSQSERSFEVGDWVYLKLQSYRQTSLQRRPAPKLAPRYYGPFVVIQKKGLVAYQLALLADSRIHLVFHTSLLKKAIGSPPPDQAPLPEEVLSPTPQPTAILDCKWSSMEIERPQRSWSSGPNCPSQRLPGNSCTTCSNGFQR